MRVADVQDATDRLSPLMEVTDSQGRMVTGMEVKDGRLVVYVEDEDQEEDEDE
jgi:hypothetical protein